MHISKALYIVVIALLSGSYSFGQDSTDLQHNYEKAKAELNLIRIGQNPNILKAGKALEAYISTNAGNPEAWYYFGNAIDYYNEGLGIESDSLRSQLPLTIKSSEAFQNALELSGGKYQGDVLVFDPHSKILNIWGAQALSYLKQGKTDSATWCFSQAGIRGGINKVVLEYFRQLMSECSYNAFLFTQGDMYAYYLYYLQLVEKYRTDLACVSLEYLNFDWYLNIISSIKAADSSQAFSLYKESYEKWDDQSVSVLNKNKDAGTDSVVSWTVKPSFDGKLLRSDIELLTFLKKNAFQQAVYFSSDVPVSMRLSLSVNNYLQLRGLTYRFVADTNTTNLAFLQSRLDQLKPLPVDDNRYLDNPDYIQVLNNYRFAYTGAAVIASNQGKSELAYDLILTADRKYPEKVLPFVATATREWYEQLRRKMQYHLPIRW